MRRRLRRDLLAWGLLAGVCAALVLGLTGGGWVKAVLLGLFVVGGCAILTLLAATSNGPSRGRHGGSAP
ncbi:MAG: hypothetical protein M3P23_11315 [Actinomycetota bacterium]|nr:hypothetical protein [Actinomycetota bacterium]